MCQLTAEVLEAYNLLRPTKINFSRWLRINPETGNGTLVDKSTVDIFIPKEIGTHGLLVLCEETLDRLEEKRSFLYPGKVEIHGKGIVLGATGLEQERSEVIWIFGLTLVHHIVNVITQSDAWLPFTLLAEPQPEVWKRNAPRLESTLQEIQYLLGIVPEVERVTDYAVIEGFHLTNHTDADNNVIPTHSRP